MNSNTLRKLNVNIREINKNFDEIVQEKLPTQALIKMEFEAIRALIDDCESLVLNDKEK